MPPSAPTSWWTIALVAVLIDRPALTLRGLGIACFLVAGLYPHSVMGPGFQMSFLAVAGLVALSEALTSKLSPPHEIGDSRISAGFRTIRLYAGGLLATSLIAGAATAPIAAYHFHTIAPFGLLGNLLAMPLVGFLVMPLGLCACLLIPFGLDAQVFALMGVAIGLVINVAETVSDLTGTAGGGSAGFRC